MGSLQKLKDAVIYLKIIKPGAVLLCHRKVINFGTPQKPQHYCICYTAGKNFKSYARIHPCTSDPKPKSPKVFLLNLEKESSVKMSSNQKDTISYSLLNVSRNVNLCFLADEQLVKYLGQLSQKTLSRFMEARRQYIISKHITEPK